MDDFGYDRFIDFDEKLQGELRLKAPGSCGRGRGRGRGSTTKNVHNNISKSCKINSKKKHEHVYFNSLQLEKLSEKKTSDILITMKEQWNELDKIMKRNMKGNDIVLLMKCVARLCDAGFNQKLDLPIMIYQSPFVTTLKRYFLNLPYVRLVDKQDNMLFWDNIEKFFDDVLKFYNNVIGQTTVLNTLKKIINANRICLQGLQKYHQVKFSKPFLYWLEEIQAKITVAMEEVDPKMVHKMSEGRSKIQHLVDPPHDFKEIDILPSVNELNSNCELFLRPNITEGAYESANHYLDMQFRLMRENFIAPMRESIMEFIANPNKKIYSGGRFYRQTKFTHKVVSPYCVGLLVNFHDDLYKKKPNFLFGSLLCFSDDNFTTLFFGTVVELFEEELADGKVVVDLINTDIDSSIFNKSFTMFESDEFYPQYGPVLEALKTCDDNFPMKEYIVDLKESADIPARAGKIYNIDGKQVHLKKENTWPSCKKLGLDECQYRAFKMGLTKEFVMIQGPSGTGKTFIGLKIVKTLLNNLGRKNLPILVMCHTNHALDRFLGGLREETNKIVRIGSQSKNKKFANKHNLCVLRKNGEILNQFRHELYNDVRARIILQNKIANVSDKGNITDITLFDEFLPQYNIRQRLIPCSALNSRSSLVNWLMMADRPQEVNNYYTSDLSEKYKELFDEEAKNRVHRVKNSENLFYKYTHDIDVYEEFSINTLKKDIIACGRSIKNTKKRDYQELLKLRNKLHLNMVELAYLEDYLGRKNMSDSVNNLHKTFIQNKRDIKSLDKNERWSLYTFWNERLRTVLLEQMAELEEIFKTTLRLYKEADLIRDSKTLNDAKIVGVTTTAAISLRSLFEVVTPSVVVVEEAAEVFESHIVVNLTEKCQQVILIGDRQQTRPSTVGYHMGAHFKSDVTLFERMYQNNKNCCNLSEQYRQPYISRLTTPEIYPLLHDHSYGNVKGVMKNLYFIDHNIPKDKDNVPPSKRNVFETQFILTLAKYLIQQGYDPEDITILVTHSGQLSHTREMCEKFGKSFKSVNKVKMCVLNNFQEEENKIILLPLVQSISMDNIKFLTIVDRVFALSGAIEGFYIVGNMDTLSTENELWKSVKNTLLKQDSFGSFLPLQCQSHGTITKIQSPEDFHTVAEGGCQNLCETLLSCSHKCQSICHVDFDDHKSYSCKQRCKRRCDSGHKCALLCSQDCECTVIVKKTLMCGHTSSLPCYLDPRDALCNVSMKMIFPLCSHEVSVKKCHKSKGRITCQTKCTDKLPCGHECQRICHKDDDPEHLNYKCLEKCDLGKQGCIICHHICNEGCHENCELFAFQVSVECHKLKRRNKHQTKCTNKLPCGHACQKLYHKDDDPEHLNYKCMEKCKLKNKGCTENHICAKRCYENCELCTIEVTKSRNNCKHSSTVPCHEDVNADPCMEKCSRILECGHFCESRCHEPYTVCKTMVKKKRSCGHFVDVECSMNPENSQCFERCKLMLECGHQCRDTCDSPCGIKRCTEKIKLPFESVCGHAFDIPCHKHKLGKTIGKLLVMEDCNKKCNTVLENCGHPCSGKCGDCRGRLHIPCSSKCDNNLVCGHICKGPCREACEMCTENCNVKCQHSVCPRLCSVPCSPCMMPCPRQCEHKKCIAKCSDMCNSSPCTEACKKDLLCGHNCRGLCGEVCPQICKVCKPEEFPELLFGNEDDDDARFVQLMDCRHAVEVNGLDKWVEAKADEAISPPKCPYCKTVIVNTARYSDQVKRLRKDIKSIKKKLCGDKDDKISCLTTLIKEIGKIESNDNYKRLESVGDWKKIIGDIKKHDNVKTFTKQLVNIKKGKKELNLSLTNIKCFQFKIHILKRLLKTFKGKVELIENEIINHQLEFISKALTQCDKNISEDQCDNFDREINRTKCIIQYLILRKAYQESVENQSSLLIEDNTELSTNLTILENELIYTVKPFSNGEVFDEKMKILQDKCNVDLKSLVFEDEKKMVVNAMGFRQGHWFKCKNDHPYNIDECGGALQRSNCPECGEVIGGANHALTAGNNLASEMDNMP